MRTTIFAALAATLVVGSAASAGAGEGSPDLAVPRAWGSESDPDGSNYAIAPYPGVPYYAAPYYRGNGYATGAPRRDDMTGQIERRRLYQENGIIE